MRARDLARARRKSRIKAAKFRARWKAAGQRAPSKTRWLAHQNSLNAERRRLGLCPDCGIPSERFVYCLVDRARRAKNNVAWANRNRMEKAA